MLVPRVWGAFGSCVSDRGCLECSFPVGMYVYNICKYTIADVCTINRSQDTCIKIIWRSLNTCRSQSPEDLSRCKKWRPQNCADGYTHSVNRIRTSLLTPHSDPCLGPQKNCSYACLKPIYNFKVCKVYNKIKQTHSNIWDFPKKPVLTNGS